MGPFHLNGSSDDTGCHRPMDRHTACAHTDTEQLLSTDIRTPPRLRRPYIAETGQSQEVRVEMCSYIVELD